MHEVRVLQFSSGSARLRWSETSEGGGGRIATVQQTTNQSTSFPSSSFGAQKKFLVVGYVRETKVCVDEWALHGDVR